MNDGDRGIVSGLIQAALVTDGGHHKQWYLEQIAKQLEVPMPAHEPGIAP